MADFYISTNIIRFPGFSHLGHVDAVVAVGGGHQPFVRGEDHEEGGPGRAAQLTVKHLKLAVDQFILGMLLYRLMTKKIYF